MRKYIACYKANDDRLRFEEQKKIKDFAKRGQGNVVGSCFVDQLWWAVRNAKQNETVLLFNELDPINNKNDRVILASLAEEFVNFVCVSDPNLNALTAGIYLKICEELPAAAR